MQLKHRDFLVRRNIVEALGELKEPGTLDILWKVILNEKNADVRHAAAEAIHLFGSEASVKYMLRLLDEKDTLIRNSVASNFANFPDKGAMRNLIMRKLDESFRRESNKFIKLNIASSMASLGDKAKAGFIEDCIFNSVELEAKRHAARSLCMDSITSDTRILKNAMDKAKDPYVKIFIACAMANCKDISGLDYLRYVVSNDKVASLRLVAAQALNRVEDSEYAYPFFIELLKDSDPAIREDAIEELAEFRNPQLVHILGDILLSDKNIIVREIAAWALGKLKDKSALVYLENGLYDDSAFVRTGVVVAIYKILDRKVN